MAIGAESQDEPSSDAVCRNSLGRRVERAQRKTVTEQELSQAKDKDLPASLIAMRRAARMARELAVRTDTAIIVIRDKKLVRVTADELRKAGVW